MTFTEKLTSAIQKNKSLLCVGLDPDPELMPKNIDVFKFNKAIIDLTADVVCAYKLNLAFYEALADEGMSALKRTVKYIPKDIPVIGDAKRGDIGNTAKAYAKVMFDILNFDATTVNPYLGFDSIKPFIQYWEKGTFILCRTSNPSAVDFQNLRLEVDTDHRYFALFEIVALRAAQWNKYNNIGLVVGATYPEELKLIRKNYPDTLLLIPGIGAQGGDIETTVKYGVNSRGEGAIINSSRQIIYASKEKNFGEAAREVALLLKSQINHYRPTTQ